MGFNKAVSPWTDDLRARVKDLWRNQSAAQIAYTLQCDGFNFSRNAVIGILHRSKLTSQDKSSEHKSARTGGQKRPRQVRSSANHIRRPKIEIEIIDFRLRCVEIVPRHLSVMDLEHDDCRYPFGDGPITFCGHPKMSGSSYCTAHHHLTRGEGTASERAATKVATHLLAVA